MKKRKSLFRRRKRKGSRLLAMALAAVVACSLMPVSALADDSSTDTESSTDSDDISILYEGTTNTCSWQIDSDGVLTIYPTDGESGTLDRYYYSTNYTPWYTYRSSIYSVVIEEGVALGRYSGYLFYGLNRATTIEGIENLDVSNATTLYYMFYGCGSLTSLDLSGWDTSKAVYMSEMFYECDSLESLNISDWDTSCVTNMRSMFEGCSSLTDLDISEWDTSSVTSMYTMFYGCSSLQMLKADNLITLSYTGSALCMFYGCSSLTSLDLSNWDVSNVTTMYGMFNGCSALEDLDISGWNTGNVENMGYMFNGCSSLTSIDLSEWDTFSVESADCMFRNCENLTSVDLSEWDTTNLTSTRQMFYGCYNLTTLDISGWEMKNIENMYFMFYQCNKLTSIDVADWDTSNVTNVQYMFAYCYSLTELDMSGWDTSYVEYYSGAFYKCTGLRSVTLGESFMLASTLPMPTDETYGTGYWKDESGTIYTSTDDIPEGTASTYTAVFDLSNFAKVTLDQDTYTYTGNEAVPVVAVNAGDAVLIEGTDYTVSYSENTNAGEAIVTIEGIGDFTGTVEKSFTIDAASIGSASITLPETDYTYDTLEKEPVPVVSIGDTILEEGIDYTVSYSDNVNAGTGTVTVEGCGNYTGTISDSFEIEGADIANAAITLEYESYTYTGSEIVPDLEDVCIGFLVAEGEVSEFGLVEDEDYTVSYADNIDAGTATITLTGNGNYSGTLTCNFEITAKSIDDVSVYGIETSYTYTGSEITPVPVVSMSGTLLTEDVDYTLSYSDNIDVGMAIVKITGIGNYKDSVSIEFYIVQDVSSEENNSENGSSSDSSGSGSDGDGITDGSGTDSDSTTGDDEQSSDGDEITDGSGTDSDSTTGDDTQDSSQEQSGDGTADDSSGDVSGVTSGETSDTSSSSETLQTQKITVKKSVLKKVIKFKKLKKKKQTFKINASAKGKTTYSKVGGNKKIKVSRKGKVTVPKGLKKGTYKIKVKIKAAATSSYKATTVTKMIKITVK